MKINPNDPWYPVVNYDPAHDKPGVTIRLQLAAGFAKALVGPEPKPAQGDPHALYANLSNRHTLALERGLHMADKLIKLANRDEGKKDGE